MPGFRSLKTFWAVGEGAQQPAATPQMQDAKPTLDALAEYDSDSGDDQETVQIVAHSPAQVDEPSGSEQTLRGPANDERGSPRHSTADSDGTEERSRDRDSQDLPAAKRPKRPLPSSRAALTSAAPAAEELRENAKPLELPEAERKEKYEAEQVNRIKELFFWKDDMKIRNYA